MNLHDGQTMTMRRGTKVCVGPLLGAGGEAFVYKATDCRDASPGVVKAFTSNPPERAERTRFLVEKGLGQLSPLFYAPTDWQLNGGVVHFSPFADGVSLEEHLETSGNSFPENCKLAIAISHALAILNENGLAHGDIQLKNFNVQKTPAGLYVAVLDFDNFIARGAPPPLSIGQDHAMAPELRAAYKAGTPIVPDEYSDRFAHTVLMHDLLLAKHVASGFDDDPDHFDACMLSGRWWHDAALGNSLSAKGGGYPSGILDPDLSRLFRRGVSLNREDRPVPWEWRNTTSRSFERIYIHPYCGGPVFADAGKTHCPFCGERYRMLKLVFSGLHREIVCDSGAVPIGRDQLLSPKVSAHHAIIQRVGPEVTVESFGRNGSYHFIDGKWIAFQNTLIEAGDRLRFADIEAYVEEVPR
jgi:DNA-binding helix-hairpin-helix protein with protein kinase domain